jgi:hypothetical protein
MNDCVIEAEEQTQKLKRKRSYLAGYSGEMLPEETTPEIEITPFCC